MVELEFWSPGDVKARPVKEQALVLLPVVESEQLLAINQAEIGNLRQEMNTMTVNITNSNGSVSQVVLRKQGVGYVGPRGEFYDHLPTGEELKPIYGF